MDAFKVLEEKIAMLVERVNTLKAANKTLDIENKKLQKKISTLEEAMLVDGQRITSLDEEKNAAKLVVESLIKNIDSLIEKQ